MVEARTSGALADVRASYPPGAEGVLDEVDTFLFDHLQSRDDVAKLLCKPEVANALVTIVWDEIGKMRLDVAP